MPDLQQVRTHTHTHTDTHTCAYCIIHPRVTSIEQTTHTLPKTQFQPPHSPPRFVSTPHPIHTCTSEEVRLRSFSTKIHKVEAAVSYRVDEDI